MALVIRRFWIALLFFSGIGAIATIDARLGRGRLNAPRIGGFFAGFLVALLHTGRNRPAGSELISG